MKSKLNISFITLLMSLVLLCGVVNAQDVIEICDDEGVFCRVYDANTLESIEGSPYLRFEKNKYDTKIFTPAEIYLKDGNELCMNQDKMYFTYYADAGAGAHPSYAWEEKQFWKACSEYHLEGDYDMKCHVSVSGPGCYITLRMAGKNTVDDYPISLCSSGGWMYHFTSKEHSYLFKDTKFNYGDVKIRVYGECYDDNNYKYYSEWVDEFTITLKNCQISCAPDYYSCSAGQSYKNTYEAVLGVCKKTTVKDTNTARNTICKKNYCEDQNKYWYNDRCNDKQQCVSSWTCGEYKSCDPETKTKLRYCNDGCGKTKTETATCVPDPHCGDGVCSISESCKTCAADCGECDAKCGDGICDVTIGETYLTCADDCSEPKKCGNGICDKDENPINCKEDCDESDEYCGNKNCDSKTESCRDCPQDCGICETCTIDSDCIPELSEIEECIDYICFKGVCAESPSTSPECEPSFWDKFKWWIIGSGTILFLGVVTTIIMITILLFLYLISRRR